MISHRRPGVEADIEVLALGADGPGATPYLRETWAEWTPHLSPDGRWLAYISNETGTGRWEVYVRGFPTPAAKYQISQGGGIAPRWSADGRTLYYLAGNQLTVADIAPGPEIRVTGRRSFPRLSGYLLGGVNLVDYDVHPDGKSFVTLKTERSRRQELTVVVNWFEELRARLGGNSGER